MALPTLRGSGSAASNATGASSVSPALGGASLAGNLIIIVVAVTATSNPSITTPANFTALINAVDGTSALAYGFFVRPNNPGGITTVAVTISGTGVQGVAASIFEFTGMPLTNQLEFSANFAGNFGSYGTNSPPLPDSNELCIFSLGHQASTVTASDLDPMWSADTANIASTNGTPNAQVDTYWGVAIGPSMVFPLLTSANINGVMQVRLLSNNSAAFAKLAGNSTLVSTVGTPAGSLQVPQPQAPGNFFSGSIGIG